MEHEHQQAPHGSIQGQDVGLNSHDSSQDPSKPDVDAGNTILISYALPTKMGSSLNLADGCRLEISVTADDTHHDPIQHVYDFIRAIEEGKSDDLPNSSISPSLKLRQADFTKLKNMLESGTTNVESEEEQLLSWAAEKLRIGYDPTTMTIVISIKSTLYKQLCFRVGDYLERLFKEVASNNTPRRTDGLCIWSRDGRFIAQPDISFGFLGDPASCLVVEIDWIDYTPPSRCKEYIDEGAVGAVLTFNAQVPVPTNSEYLPEYKATLYAKARKGDELRAEVVEEWLINDANTTDFVGDGKETISIPLHRINDRFVDDQNLTLTYRKLNKDLFSACEIHREQSLLEEKRSHP